MARSIAGGRRHRACRADHEHEEQQCNRRGKIERDERREHRRRHDRRNLDYDQEASFVHDVRQGAGRQREQKHRQAGATWTSDTINGCMVRLVISHAAAALYIQVPTLATTVAVQITANAR